MNCDIVFNLFEKDSISRLKDGAPFKLMKRQVRMDDPREDKPLNG